MGIDIAKIKLSRNNQDVLFNLAVNYLNIQLQDLNKTNLSNITSERLVESFVLGLSTAKSRRLSTYYTSHFQKGKAPKKIIPRNITWEDISDIIKLLQSGNQSEQRLAWLIAHCLCHLNPQINLRDQHLVNSIFAQVDKSVKDMSWEINSSTKYLPSIIIGQSEQGEILNRGKSLAKKTHFESINKQHILNESTVRQLYTKINDDGKYEISLSKLECKIDIGISHRNTIIEFNTALNRQMNVSLEEVANLLNDRYPYFEAHKKITFSATKEINQDSRSCGLGIALTLYSLYEGFKIEPRLIAVGDISLKGNILPAFDMAEKISIANKSYKNILLVSHLEYDAVMDATIKFGHKALWKCQIIAAKDLSQAINIARQDRPKLLAQAIEEFKSIQKMLVLDSKRISTAKNSLTKRLKSILKKAPNHYSAKALLELLQGKPRRYLSLYTSLDLFMKTTHHILDEINDKKTATFSHRLRAYAKLKRIRHALNPAIKPLISEVLNYLSQNRDEDSNNAAKTKVILIWKELNKSRKFVDNM